LFWRGGGRKKGERLVGKTNEGEFSLERKMRYSSTKLRPCVLIVVTRETILWEVSNGGSNFVNQRTECNVYWLLRS
jgi:hypothetical protein